MNDYINDMLGTVVQASKAEGYDVLAGALAETRKELDGVCGELAEVKGERDKAIELLRNLLARIHRDGGHYVAHYGLARACEEAEAVWVRREVEAAEVKECCARLAEELGALSEELHQRREDTLGRFVRLNGELEGALQRVVDETTCVCIEEGPQRSFEPCCHCAARQALAKAGGGE